MRATISNVLFLILISIFFLILLTFGTRKRDGAICEDGWKSSSTGSGTCSHHGGVDNWTYDYWFE